MTDLTESLLKEGWYLSDEGIAELKGSAEKITHSDIIRIALDADLRPVGRKVLPSDINSGRTEKDELEATQEGAEALVAVVSEEEVLAGVPFETHHMSIVLEDQVVTSHRSWPDSLIILFGLIYALYLSCPEKLSGFFEFIQIVLLNFDGGRKRLQPKLQALRNELE